MIFKNQMMLPVGMLFVFALSANNPNTLTKKLSEYQNSQVEKMKKRKVIFLVTEDSLNYEAHKTIPRFAGVLENKYGYDVTVLLGSGGHGSYRYPAIDMISTADLLIIFARRIALPHEQMNILKNYLTSGKPLIGIRTANHAFTVLDTIDEGYEDYPEFVANVLGCKNRGYGPVDPGTDVSIVPAAAGHPVVKNIEPQQWHSKGNIYRVAPLLDKEATILLTGKVNDIEEPVAWTRTAGKRRVFYTSLGFSADFDTAPFVTLLVNAIKWALMEDQ